MLASILVALQLAAVLVCGSDALDLVPLLQQGLDFGDGIGIVGGIGNAADDCSLTCPTNQTLRFNPNATLIMPNGCGVQGFLAPQPFVDFGGCCDVHDLCYASCQVAKDDCDRSFAACMEDQCRRQFRDGFNVGTPRRRLQCEAQARTFRLAVTLLGCPYFKAAQNESCLCV